MKKMVTNGKLPGSFRDPSGFLFLRNGVMFRQVNTIYKENYDYFIDSSLYENLVDAELLIPHDEVDITYAKSDKAYKIIRPEFMPPVGYARGFIDNPEGNGTLGNEGEETFISKSFRSHIKKLQLSSPQFFIYEL